MHRHFIFRSFKKVAGIEYRPDSENIYVKWGDVDDDMLKAFGDREVEQIDIMNTSLIGGVAYRMSAEQPPEKKTDRTSTGLPTFKFYLDQLIDRANHKKILVLMRVKND